MKRKKNRRLAAIMFTDIVGYTALMQKDEGTAMQIRSRHRSVFEQKHTEHRGEIIQYFGDGTLSLFQSGVEAVACAIELQRSLQQDPLVPLRIGIHIGDIVFDGTDIYGDSVNVASRIESMGKPGGVLISDKLNEELRNHPTFETQSMGLFEFKNVEEPMQLFAIANQGILVPDPDDLKGKGQRLTKTIAVLPFVNRSPDPENEYFSDGMSEEIINALSKIDGLKVTSRTSSFFFKNKQVPIAEVGQQLNVSTILEGSIRLAGGKMRITAQLIDVRDDVHFWSETFDRSIDDIFAVQDEISLLIADKLREHLGHFEIKNSLVESKEVSVETYKHYLKSRYHLLKMTKPDLEEGMAILRTVIEEQPNFALAYTGMHLGYTLLGMMGLMPAHEAFAEGRVFLDKAIELEEQLPEVQLHLSYDAFLQQWDLAASYRHLNKSFEIRPTVEFYQSMASVLGAERKFDAALNYIETALQLDPFSEINYHLKGFIYYAQEQYEKAIESFEKAAELKPEFLVSTQYLGQVMLLTGRAKEGLAMFQKMPEDGPEDLTKLGFITLAYAALGDADRTTAGIAKLEEALNGQLVGIAVNALMLCHSMLGNQQAALEMVERGVELRLPMMVYLYSEPIFKPLYALPRFQKLVKQVLGEGTNFDLPKRKYKQALFDEKQLQQYKRQLEQLMSKDKPYLNPDLTLRSLADKMSIPANHLSQLLNEGFNKNFSEFVNTYRLETFKLKVADPAERHLTLLALAYDSGFNSKTVFNTFFKKVMNKTPKAYWKEVVGK